MITIKPWVKDAPPEHVQALEEQFAAMYAYMADKGLAHALVPDGPKIWSKSVIALLGRMTYIFGAWDDEQLVGFVAGTIRSQPPYLKGGRYGAWTQAYVAPTVREGGVGKRLFEALADAFRADGMTMMELDVLMDNAVSRSYCERMGFKAHHLIMYRDL